MPAQDTRGRAFPRPPEWMDRCLVAVVVIAVGALLSAAADAGVCIALVHDVRACVATASDNPAAVPASSEPGGGATG